MARRTKNSTSTAFASSSLPSLRPAFHLSSEEKTDSDRTRLSQNPPEKTAGVTAATFSVLFLWRQRQQRRRRRACCRRCCSLFLFPFLLRRRPGARGLRLRPGQARRGGLRLRLLQGPGQANQLDDDGRNRRNWHHCHHDAGLAGTRRGPRRRRHPPLPRLPVAPLPPLLDAPRRRRAPSP